MYNKNLLFKERKKVIFNFVSIYDLCEMFELQVPLDLPDREKSLPALEGKDIDMVGMTWKQASSDIQLSSLGELSI